MKRIVFVCTGNTCRSPMAELILKKLFKDNSVTGIRVSSAGIYAEDGAKMSKNSIYALKKRGINPYNFRSKKLTEEILTKADKVICMTKEHKDLLAGYDNVFTFSEVAGVEDISDPYGGDKERYEKTACEIEQACNKILEIILR